MKIAPLLYAAFTELQEAAMGLLSGTRIETIAEKINKFAIYSAVAGAAVCAVPGAGGTIAALTQTGLVWTLYVQINKTLGISIKDNVLKLIGSAVLTNLAANAGTYIVAYAAASILSFIPGLGTAGAVLIGAATGYMVIYAAAIVYLRLLTKMMKTSGNFEFDESEDTKVMIDEVVGSADVKGMVEEGRDAFKAARKSGEFKEAMKNPKCPSCGAPVTAGQKFCSECGTPLN